MILNLISEVGTNMWHYIFVENISTVLEGLLNTFLIVVCSFPIGIAIGALVGIVHFVPNKSILIRIWKWINAAYVALFRGTPLAVQLLFIYFVMLMPLGIPNLIVAILVFGLNSGAYVSEIVRSGIASVDKGQMEAGRSLGISYAKTMFKVVLPQAIKNIIPTLGNELISLTKETSVAGFATVVDITKAIDWLSSNKFEYVVGYFVLGLFYFVIVFIISRLLKLIERRLSRSDKR